MKITSLITKLREKGIAIKLVDSQLEVAFSKDDIAPELLEELKEKKQELVSYLSSIPTKNSYKEIPKVKEREFYPVSNAQLRMWLECQSEDASVAYHMPIEIYLTGDYEVGILEKSIRHVIDRFEILRTTFRLNHERELKQYITPSEEVCFKVDYHDFRESPNGEVRAKEHIKNQVNIPFNLEQGPLMRASLLQYKDGECIFFFNLHHIICDAWSIPILKQEIFNAYTELSAGKSPQSGGLRIQYKDYATWYINELQNNNLVRQKEYWKDKFADEIPVLEFPSKSTRPPIKTYNGQTLKTYLGKSLTKKIHAYRQQQNGSLFMVMLSTLYTILGRYSGASDIVIGSPFSAREHAELKNQVGFYTNTLAIRNQLEKEDTFDSFFFKVKESVLEAYRHQQYPFDELVKELKLKKDPSRNPLFDVMLVVLSDDQSLSAETFNESDSNTILTEKNTTSKFDLLLYVQEIGDCISLKIEYNTDLYEEEFIRQFLGHYKGLTELLLLYPQQNLNTINYLPEETICITREASLNYQPETVISLFEKQVEKTPESIAVCYENILITYSQLNEYANQIAFHLSESSYDTTQTNIGVLLGRSHLNVVAMFGVIKSGACYVPIDAKYHDNLKQYIINDAEINTVLSTTDIYNSDRIGKAKVLHLDTFTFSQHDTENPPAMNQLDDTAFIIYTSGSTGNPKGVIQTHRMLSNLIQWNRYDAGIPSGLKHLQYTSFSFDVSLQDCWFVLSSGSTLHIAPEAMKVDFQALSNYIVEHGIAVLSFPFSALSNFFKHTNEAFLTEHKLEHIISSGEQLVIEKALEKFLLNSPEVKLHNHYGPSETHVITSHTVSAGENSLPKYVPIGKPVANTSLYLLDTNRQPVPEMVIGELYVGGENLAKGYVKLPDLTNERFINNPFRKDERLYKTGDLAYKDDKGIFTYIGRNDDQVKIRGFRIELAEIKRAILLHEKVHQAHVEVVELKEEKAIAAYIVGEELDPQLLKKWLNGQLPQYMVPSYIIRVAQLSLTANGKINKKELPDVTQEALVKAPYVAPATLTEKDLIAVWEKILEVSPIGIYDNFFELGGHSLHITRMLYDINEAFAVKLQIKNVFASQNVHELAQLIENEIAFKKLVLENNAGKIEENQNSDVWEI